MRESVDVSLKDLLLRYWVAWLKFFNIPHDGETRLVDSQATAVASTPDKLIWVDAPTPFLVMLEFQSSNPNGLPEAMFLRQTLHAHNHRMPVISILVLLRKDADRPFLTGIYTQPSPTPNNPPSVTYNYRVVRLWELPPESFLEAGVGVVPLTLLGNVNRDQVPNLLRKMKARFEGLPQSQQDTLWTITHFLMGLRFDSRAILEILEESHHMWIKDSSLYQLAVAEGEEKGEERGILKGRAQAQEELQQRELTHFQDTLLRLGAKRFGAPPPATCQYVQSIDDVEKIQRLLEGMLEPNLNSWEDLLKCQGSA